MYRYLLAVTAVIAALSMVHAVPYTQAMFSECALSIPDHYDADALRGVEKTLWCLAMLSNFEDPDDQTILRATCGNGDTFGTYHTSTLHSSDGFQKLFITELVEYLRRLFTTDVWENRFDVYREKTKCVLRLARSLAKNERFDSSEYRREVTTSSDGGGS